MKYVQSIILSTTQSQPTLVPEAPNIQNHCRLFSADKMPIFSATQLNLADLHLQLYLLQIPIVQESCLNITSDIDQPPSTQCEIVTLVFEEELTKTQQINVCQLTPSCFPYCQ